MNVVTLVGRSTKDCDVRYSQDLCIAKFTLAVDRRYSKDQERKADFIRCTVFGKRAEWAEKYVKKGTKLEIVGEIRTDSFQDKDGKTVYTTEVLCNELNFGESKGTSQAQEKPIEEDSGFTNVPDDIEDSLPFN